MGEPYFPEYGILDQDGALRFICNKIPDWHNRLRDLEAGFEQHRKEFSVAMVKLNEIHTAICGSTDGEKRGLFLRMEMQETFKRVACWALGVLYIAVVSSGVAILFKGCSSGLQ